MVMAGCVGRGTHSQVLDGVSVVYGANAGVRIRGGNILLNFRPQQTLRVAMLSNGVETSIENAPSGAETEPSDFVAMDGKDVTGFQTDYSRISIQRAQTRLGNCDQVEIPSRGTGPNADVEKVMSISLCSAFPDSAIFSTTYTNRGNASRTINRVVQVRQTLRFPDHPDGLWTFEGASVSWGRDFIFPLPGSFHAENAEAQMMGARTVTFNDVTHHLPEGAGGGIPVNDFWTGQMGLAIGHIETDSVACWMPVETLPGSHVRISIETRPDKTLGPGQSYATPHSFVTVHPGDFYSALSTYSAMLRAEGVSFMKFSPDLYEPTWWTYGYGHNYRTAQVYQTIPMLKKLGIKWIMLNNRWWDHYGDWMPREDKFGGEAAFKEFVARLHSKGFKVLVWWMPYGVQLARFQRSGLFTNPVGAPKQSPYIERIISESARVAIQHPDWLIEDQQGDPVPISRNLASLCPAYPPARDHILQLATRMIRDWKIDGLYMDEIHTIPSCRNPAHHHSSPYDSVKQLSKSFQDIRQVIEQYDPDGMAMICPCGQTINYCLLADTNEPVTADPVGSQQVRWRIKMYKALLGPQAPVFADRVESTYISSESGHDLELGSDFASGMGTGGIIGTRFSWPKLNQVPGDLEYTEELQEDEDYLLTPEKVADWERWFDLYRQKMLSDGEFLNLYTLGFDNPEGYAIRKGRDMYYAFFVSQPRAYGIDLPPVLPKPRVVAWEGRLELQGLNKSQVYRVIDYEHGKDLGTVSGSNPYLQTRLVNHLLVEVSPSP
jgi:alpha-galactosidase